MITHAKSNQRNAAVLAIALLAITTLARSAPVSERQSLERGAVADLTPQEKYQTAIREAGGAYKAARRDCGQAAADDRSACAREARTTYEIEMADARRILRGG